MTSLEYCTLCVHAHSIFGPGLIDLVQHDLGLDRDTGTDEEPGRSIDETARDQSEMVFFAFVEDGVAGVGSVSSSNAYVGLVLQGQVGSYLASRGRYDSSFPSSPKKPPTMTVTGKSLSDSDDQIAE